MHFFVIYHGMTMTKQVENQRKLHKFFFLVNLNYNMSYLPQHSFRTLRKIQLLIGHKRFFFRTNGPPLSPMTLLPKPYNDQHVFFLLKKFQHWNQKLIFGFNLCVNLASHFNNFPIKT
jgi:hypothetical protein